MKFEKGIFGYLKLGIVFSLFMLVVMLIFTLVVLPVVLIPTLGVILTGGSSIFTYMGAIFSVFLIIISFIVIGWAVYYFNKKNIFIGRKR
jgi:hypothetical protein